MNRDMSSSKVMPSLYNYSHTYELEYSYCVIILIYELVYSLYVMKVAYLTLCLTTHITYIIRIRAKLRWQFIMLSGVPKSFSYRSVGSGTPEDLGSFCIRKRGAWVWRDMWMHCPSLWLRRRWHVVTPQSNMGEYKGWIGLSPPAAYPSTVERDNALTYISKPKHHACIYRNYPNPLRSLTLRIDR